MQMGKTYLDYSHKMMKYFLSLAFTLLSVVCIAQLKAGTVNYSIVAEKGMENNPMAKEMMKDAKMVVSFAPKKSSVKTTMGIFMTSVTTVQVKKKKAVTLMDAMGTKTGVNFTLAELKKQNHATTELVETNDTKVILGYTCKKATYTAEGGVTGEIWYTTEIVANTDGQQFFGITDKGFILEELSITNGVSIRITATSIEPKAPEENLFSLEIPEGYKIMTAEEFEKSQGGI